MKISKVLVATIATSSIILSMWTSFAAGAWMMWNGQSMWMWNWNGWWMWINYNISNIPKWDLNATETDLLYKQYEEEMMANELYTSFYEKYGIITFQNIAASEKVHKEAVKTLLDRYGLTAPTSYSHIQTLYDQLKTKWDLSLKDALEVGINIETTDINDIVTAIKSTDNDDIKTVLVNIGWASYNHLRGFVQALDMNSLITDIDYSPYLTEDDLNTRWPISSKLIDKLEAEWVTLPTYVTNQKWNMHYWDLNWQMWNFRWNWYGMWKWYGMWMNNRYANNNTLRSQYKNAYKTKYWNALAKMDDNKLNEFVTKIDALIEKINSSNTYTDVVKEKYISMLLALRDLALENVDEWNIIENLFN